MSVLRELLARGAFVVTAEVGPPKGTDRESIKKKCAQLRGFVDAVNITDNQTAIVRLSSFASCLMVREVGLEPVMQLTCRDRNRIALQSDFLGACALGIENFLCLTGDHQSLGNHPEARSVFDVDSVQLLAIFRRIRDEGVFANGEKVKGEVRAFLGAGENPFADPLEFRVFRLAKKVEAGAQFIQTQAVFDLEMFSRWMEEVRRLKLHEKVHILAGVIPLKSLQALRYMKEEVPGMVVPSWVEERMRKARDPKEEGVRIAVETIEALRKIEGVRGVHIMAVAWESVVPDIVKASGLFPRPGIGGGAGA
ncbi:MAG: methylenetetrahydrofolate reductase [Candidatus Caldatribacterium sp.]|nr:methylenetetrahydrofolate reductase [Candidatus Caldatribacterium sp.]